MRFGFRKIEAIVGTLIFTVLVIFIFEVFIASPHVNEVLSGFVPSKEIITNNSVVYCTWDYWCYNYATQLIPTLFYCAVKNV